MPITTDTNYQVLLNDDVVNVTPTANRTITLPNVADAKGRTYRIVKNNAAAFSVAVTGITPSPLFATTAQYVGESFTSNGTVWSKGSDGVRLVVGDTTALTTDVVIHIDALDAARTVTLYAATGNVGKRLRVANINGLNNVTVVRASTDQIISAPSGTEVTSITIAPGKAANLIVSSASRWKDQASDIQIVTTTPVTIVDGTTTATAKTVINVDASGGARTITLPSAASRFGKDYVGPQIFVSKVDSSANVVTVQRGGSDLVDGVATAKTLSAPGMLSLTASGTTTWLSPVTVTPTALAGAGSSVTDLTSAAVIDLTHTTAKVFRLIDAPTHKSIVVNNTGAGTATIHKSATKTLFTSAGYVPSLDILTGRSAAFTYSDNLNAWIKV